MQESRAEKIHRNSPVSSLCAVIYENMKSDLFDKHFHLLWVELDGVDIIHWYGLVWFIYPMSIFGYTFRF